MLGRDGRNTFIVSAEIPVSRISVAMWGAVARSRKRTEGAVVMSLVVGRAMAAVHPSGFIHM